MLQRLLLLAGAAAAHEAAAELGIQDSHRNIFSYWNTGFPPLFQRRCLDNFRRYNPTWSVILLNQESAPRAVGRHMLPLTFDEMSPQLQSDAVRLAALRVYGGVWSDITNLFVRMDALDGMWSEMIGWNNQMRGYSWLSNHIFESWFIMAVPGSSILAQWHDIFNAYYETRSQADQIGSNNLMSALNPTDRALIENSWWNSSMLDYLSIHAFFLRTIALDEWGGGENGTNHWQTQVHLDDGWRDGGYYVEQALCNWNGDCFRDRMFRDGLLSASEVATHTPLIKLNSVSMRTLFQGRTMPTDDDLWAIFDTPNGLLHQLLTPPADLSPTPPHEGAFTNRTELKKPPQDANSRGALLPPPDPLDRGVL